MNYYTMENFYHQYIVHRSEYIMRDKKLGQILCKRIAYLIKENNLTIEQLAYQSGISKGGLSEICREMKEPTNYTIMKICTALNMTMSEFFDFEELTKYAQEQY